MRPFVLRPFVLRPLVGVDDTHDEVAADDVVPLEAHEGDTLDAVERSPGVLEATHLPLGQVHLGGVSRYDHLGAESQAREEHLHLLRRGILRLIEDDERVVQGTASHKRQRCDLDYTPLQVRLELGRVDHLVQSVVEGPEIRIHLRHHVPRQEAQRLPRLDRGPGQDDPGDLPPVQSVDRQSHREVCLAGPRGTDSEDDLVLADGVGVGLLVACLRRDAAAPVRDDNVPQDLLAAPVRAHPVQALGRLGTRVVAALRELDEAVEDRLGSFDRGLFPVQQDLVPAHDHLALHELLDAPQYSVPVPKDLQHTSRRHHQLDLDLSFSPGFRVSS